MKLIPYLTFNGNTEEALDFYKSIFGGNAEIMRFSEMPADPEMPVSDTWKNKVMHASLSLPGGNTIYFSDVFEGGTVTFGDSITVHVEFDSEEELREKFAPLSAGGKVTMPVDRMFWGAIYGSVTDKFGINWGLHHQLPE